MYLSWAERRGYEAVALAEGERPSRAVLRFLGPGVMGSLRGSMACIAGSTTRVASGPMSASTGSTGEEPRR